VSGGKREKGSKNKTEGEGGTRRADISGGNRRRQCPAGNRNMKKLATLWEKKKRRGGRPDELRGCYEREREKKHQKGSRQIRVGENVTKARKQDPGKNLTQHKGGEERVSIVEKAGRRKNIERSVNEGPGGATLRSVHKIERKSTLTQTHWKGGTT